MFSDDIYSLALAATLPTLPFEVFRQLLNCSPLTTDDGVILRRMIIEVGAMHLVLNCLGIFTHHSQMYQLTSSTGLQEVNLKKIFFWLLNCKCGSVISDAQVHRLNHRINTIKPEEFRSLSRKNTYAS